ncbi:MAG: hypothetical protein WAV05_05865 [Anaerolineales bacterium]
MYHSHEEVIERTIREFELLRALKTVPEKWFSGRERRAEWPYDLDGHSSYHRTRDIEQSLASRIKD